MLAQEECGSWGSRARTTLGAACLVAHGGWAGRGVGWGGRLPANLEAHWVEPPGRWRPQLLRECGVGRVVGGPKG